MAKQIEGVFENVLDCAKKEFLAKGYIDASLRTIAQEAGTSTGSIYTRFGDKEGLFRAIVAPAADGLKEMFLHFQETFHAFDAEVQRNDMGQYSESGMEQILDFIYDHFDDFRLLLDASYGTLYQNFVDELVDIEVEYTYKFLQVLESEILTAGQMTHDFIHIVVTCYVSGMFEVVRHGMSREDAQRYAGMLGRYHRAGFCTILGFPTN